MYLKIREGFINRRIKIFIFQCRNYYNEFGFVVKTKLIVVIVFKLKKQLVDI